MSTSKTGKHGHAKVHLIATDVSHPCLPKVHL
jgi:translation elongation factor P/translation initiation factor 5A